MYVINMKITDAHPPLPWINDTLLSRGYAVGDLVAYSVPLWNNYMTIYRITQDFAPCKDAVWGRYKDYSKSSENYQLGWIYPNTKKKIPRKYLCGCVEIEPVYQIIRGTFRPTKRIVEYRNFRRLKKLDLLELGRTFAEFKEFIEKEVINYQISM